MITVSGNSFPAMSGLLTDNYISTYFTVLAISCPYSRAEHIPCQNSWEISGNCEDPFQVKYFIQFAKYSFSSGTYVVDCTCSSPKKILTFNNFWKCHN